jgi:hypothetical protein
MQLPAVTRPAPDVAAPQVYGGGLSRPGQKRCPHCGEDVVGDEPRCPHCDTVFDETRREQERSGPDWEQRDRLGSLRAFWGTFKGTMFDPVRTFDRARLKGFGKPLAYTAVCAVIAASFNALYYVLMQTPQLLLMGSGRGPGVGLTIGVILGMGAVNFVMGIGVHFVWVIFSSGLTHLGLLVFKSAREPFETTCRAIAYADSAAHLWNVVPVCGAFIGIVWGIVASIIGVARMHKIDYGKATLAVLIPVGVLVALFLLVVAIFVFAVIGASRL